MRAANLTVHVMSQSPAAVQAGPTPERSAPRRPRRAFVPSSGMAGPPASMSGGQLPTVYSADADPHSATSARAGGGGGGGGGWTPDDELGMMPMHTSGSGHDGRGYDNGSGGGGGGGSHTAASLVEGARGFLEGFRQMAVGGGAEAAPEGDLDVEDGMGVASDEGEWEDDEQQEYEQDDSSSRVSSTVSSDDDSDGGSSSARRKKKKGRRKARSRKRRGSTASSVGSASSYVSSVTSVSSVSSEGLRRAFEESLEQAMRAAADADEANAERRRLADEYLDVALYIYDQVGTVLVLVHLCRESLQADAGAFCAVAAVMRSIASGNGGNGSATGRRRS